MAKFAVFIFGLVVGAFAMLGWVIYQEAQKHREGSELIFAPKNFLDSRMSGDLGAVYISGTLTGNGLEYPNNTYAVSCLLRYKACFVSYVEQLDREHIGKMQNPMDYPIVKWDNNEIVAQEEPSLSGCHKVSMTIDRRLQTLVWLQEPINQLKENCRDSDSNMRKYTIEDSPQWKRIIERLRSK